MPIGIMSSMSAAAPGGPIDDKAAYQLALSLGRLAGLAGSLPGAGLLDGRIDMVCLDEALRESRRSCNMTECVSVPSSEHVAEIVGRQGCKIKALRAKTNTYIKTPVRGEEPVFVVTGRRDDVTSAKREILSAAEHFSQIRASRRTAAGAGSSGGAAGSASIACTPTSASSSCCAGLAPGVAGAPASTPVPGQVTAMVRVPYRVVGLVVGPKGATIKRIQQSTNTYIVTPSREKEPVFEVTGYPESVEKARAEIERHIASRAGDTAAAAASSPPRCGASAPPGCPLAAGSFQDTCDGSQKPSTFQMPIGSGISFTAFGGMSANACRDLLGGGGSSSFSAFSSLPAVPMQPVAYDLSCGIGHHGDSALDELLSAARGDSGCGASLAGDLDCAVGAPSSKLHSSVSCIWSSSVGCGPCQQGSLCRGSGGGAYGEDSAACSRSPAVRRHSAGVRRSPVEGKCQGQGRRCSHDEEDAVEIVASRRGATPAHGQPMGYPVSATVGAFPMSSASSGCSSSSTSPVVERRQRGTVASPRFGSSGRAAARDSYYRSQEEVGSVLGEADGDCVAAAAATYSWCYGSDPSPSFDERRVGGSF